jgi:hypothetical protein
MKIADHLNKEQKDKLNKIRKPNKKTKKRNRTPKKPTEEKIDWHDIMGTNNRGLRRGKGGAWRQ